MSTQTLSRPSALVPLKAVTEATKLSSDQTREYQKSKMTSALVNPVQEITGMTGVSLVGVMQNATQSVKNPLEDIDSQLLEDLHIPWYDRFLLSTG